MKKLSIFLSTLSLCILCSVSSCKKENFNDFKTNHTTPKNVTASNVEVVQNSIVLDTPYNGTINPAGILDTPYNGTANVVGILDTPYNTTLAPQIILDTPYNKQ
jgi:hypothetical protein